MDAKSDFRVDERQNDERQVVTVIEVEFSLSREKVSSPSPR